MVTTCDWTEGRNLSTHLDLCVSFVTQKISQNGLRIVTPLCRRALVAVQAIGDPAFDSGRATRSHHKRCLIHGGAARTRHDDAMPGKRLLPLHPRVCPFLTLAVLPAPRPHRGSFPMLPGSKPTLVLLWPFSTFTSRAWCRASGGGCRPLLYSATFIAASFIAASPFPTASFVDMLSRCYPPTSYIVFEQMKG